MLKAKGVGAKISYASQKAPNEIREGDRKIIVQIVTNMDYWNYIPYKNFPCIKTVSYTHLSLYHNHPP